MAILLENLPPHWHTKSIMRTVISFLFASLLAGPVLLGDIAKVEDAILKEFIENTSIKATALEDASLLKCFQASFYSAEIKMKESGGATYSWDTIHAQTENGMATISEPGTNAEMPELLKLVNPSFRLKTKADGETMMKALKVLFESTFDDDVEARVLQEEGKWSFIVGDFFKKFSGFVIETDAEGTITKISRSLEIEG